MPDDIYETPHPDTYWKRLAITVFFWSIYYLAVAVVLSLILAVFVGPEKTLAEYTALDLAVGLVVVVLTAVALLFNIGAGPLLRLRDRVLDKVTQE